MQARAELVVSSGDNKQSLIIGDTYIQYFPLERWMENQNCLLFNYIYHTVWLFLIQG
jgi:hypothetical protein